MNLLIEFGATFLGVIASFSLWFGGQKLLQYQSEKKARKYLIAELEEETKMLIGVLDVSATGIIKCLHSREIPVHLPKLFFPTYQYANSSGEIRFIKNHEMETLIRQSAYICQGFNEFINNTELQLSLFNFKPQPIALELAHHRLNGFLEQSKDTKNFLKYTLDKLAALN
ncbi:MAG: hypothetical protein MUO89_05325 [Dehalococcoidia bacterium]|nr:hypothetical protein [Dehalococcoidia bacterium]